MSSKVKGDAAKLKAKKSVSRSSKAGLQFPVGRIHRHLKQRVTAKGRVGATAAGAMAASVCGEAMAAPLPTEEVDSPGALSSPSDWAPSSSST